MSLRRGAVVLAARRRRASTWAPALPEPPVFHADPSQYSGVELTFLGTSSQVCARRHPSSLALRLRAHQSTHTWLFDAGEGALAQLQRSHLRVSQLRNIFITHMHPDHVYGLPGVVMSALSARDAHNARAASPAAHMPPLTVYGPPGIRTFLRASLGATLPSFRSPALLRIVELALPKDAASGWRFNAVRPFWTTPVRRLPFELPAASIPFETHPATGAVTYNIWTPAGESAKTVERNLALGNVGVRVSDSGHVSAVADDDDAAAAAAAASEPVFPAFVQAGIVSHSVPSIAYVITEDVSQFRFDKDKLGAAGIPIDGRPGLQSLFHRLLAGETVEHAGKTISREDVSKEAREPRRVCIVGDTSDAKGIAHLAQGVDVLVHEATLRAAETDIARKRGHSSSLSAALFAKEIEAKRLILNHTSVAYDSREVRALEGEARRVLGSDRAFVAHDMSVFNVPTSQQGSSSLPFRSFLGHPRWDYPELLRNAANLYAVTSAEPAGKQKPAERENSVSREKVDSAGGASSSKSSGKPKSSNTTGNAASSASARDGDTQPAEGESIVASTRGGGKRRSSRQISSILRVADPRHARHAHGTKLVLEEADFTSPMRAFRKVRRSFAAV